jgi:hypothetical protein
MNRQLHLLPGQRDSAIDALEDIKTCSLRYLRIDKVHNEITVLYAVLELGREVLKTLCVQLGLLWKLEPQLVIDEALEGGQAL